MLTKLAQEAIKAALNQEWKQAVDLNEKILSIEESDIDAMNRLARALSETGDLKGAQKYAREVLTIDSENQIAIKNLCRWGKLKSS